MYRLSAETDCRISRSWFFRLLYDDPSQDGQAAQEENLFRRTNLFQALDAKVGEFAQAPDYRIGQNPPGLGDLESIYSANITVIRDTEDSGYAFLAKPFEVSSIAVHAIKRTDKDRDTPLTNAEIILTKAKIDSMFIICLKHEHDVLVLSAVRAELAFLLCLFSTPHPSAWVCTHACSPIPAWLRSIQQPARASRIHIQGFASVLRAILQEDRIRSAGWVRSSSGTHLCFFYVYLLCLCVIFD